MQAQTYRRVPDVVGAQLDPRGFAAALAAHRGFVVISENVAAIPLRRGKRSLPEEFVLVSREDRHLGRYYWSVTKWRYPRRRNKNGKAITLHREVMGLSDGDGLVVDHINRDRFDCRRENLRIVTHAENCQNLGARTNAVSKFRGVSRAMSGKWRAMHTINGKVTYIGTYDTEEEANEGAKAWRAIHMPFAID